MKSRILIIDDEAEIRKSLRMILEYEGYDVLEASSGADGLAMAERETPDLVFLDVKMPGMDGLEVLQRLQAVHAGHLHVEKHQIRRLALRHDQAVRAARGLEDIVALVLENHAEGFPDLRFVIDDENS